MKRTMLMLAIALAASVPPAVMEKSRQEAPAKAVKATSVASLERAQVPEGQTQTEDQDNRR